MSWRIFDWTRKYLPEPTRDDVPEKEAMQIAMKAFADGYDVMFTRYNKEGMPMVMIDNGRFKQR